MTRTLLLYEVESRYILPFWEKVLRFFRSPWSFHCSRVRSNLLIPALRMWALQGMAPNLELFDMLAFTNGAINSKDQASHNHINSNQYIFQGKGSWRCRGALSLSQQQLYLKSPRKPGLLGGYILRWSLIPFIQPITALITRGNKSKHPLPTI